VDLIRGNDTGQSDKRWRKRIGNRFHSDGRFLRINSKGRMRCETAKRGTGCNEMTASEHVKIPRIVKR